MTDTLLTASQAAALLGVSRQYVSRLIRNGRLPAIRIGNQWVVKRADLEPWVVKRGGVSMEAMGFHREQ